MGHNHCVHLPRLVVVNFSYILMDMIIAEQFFLFLFTGSMGNLTEQKFYVLLSLLFIVPAVFGYLYHLLWQTYV